MLVQCTEEYKEHVPNSKVYPEDKNILVVGGDGLCVPVLCHEKRSSAWRGV